MSYTSRRRAVPRVDPHACVRSSMVGAPMRLPPRTRVTTLHTGLDQMIQSTKPSGATSSPSAQGVCARFVRSFSKSQESRHQRLLSSAAQIDNHPEQPTALRKAYLRQAQPSPNPGPQPWRPGHPPWRASPLDTPIVPSPTPLTPTPQCPLPPRSPRTLLHAARAPSRVLPCHAPSSRHTIRHVYAAPHRAVRPAQLWIVLDQP